MCVYVETNTEKVIVLPLLVVKAKRWSAGEEILWDMNRTVITLTWNQNTGTFDQTKVDQPVVRESKPAPVPPATPPPPQVYVIRVEATSEMQVIGGRTVQGFTWYYSDGSQATFNLYFVNDAYYYSAGNGVWTSSTDVHGPWAVSSPPPQNATPPAGAGGTVHDQN